MKHQRIFRRCLVTATLIFTVLQVSSCVAASSRGGEIVKPANRADSVRALAHHLGLGEGSVIADIGAGRGRDTWVFAGIVSKTGMVFAEEIDREMVEKTKDRRGK